MHTFGSWFLHHTSLVVSFYPYVSPKSSRYLNGTHRTLAIYSPVVPLIGDFSNDLEYGMLTLENEV